jgi:CRP-like cAMP-binding protein
VGAEVRDYKPAENIFCEGDTPNYYYQIIKGEVKLNNYNEEGRSLYKIFYQKDKVVENLYFL